MPFERVTIQLRDGRQHGGVDWPTVVEWVRQRRLPTNAMLTDEATGEQRAVGSFPELTAAANAAGGGDAASTIIPYKNAPALTSYYLGVFSLLACVPFLGIFGIPMAIAAFVLGLKGLRKVKEQPECKGDGPRLDRRDLRWPVHAAGTGDAGADRGQHAQ
jgi:hypothetical protein